MDKELRNTLRGAVTKCRKLLEDAVGELLEGQFGIHRTGKVEDADKLKHLGEGDQEYRAQVLAHYEHIKAAGFKPADAMGQLIREVAFTHLNRLCAYKLMEKRGLIRESVSRGLKSQGVSFHLAEHSEDEKLWDGGKQDIAYRHFLEAIGARFADEIPILFSPHDPANRLFPPQRVLDEVLELINAEALKDIWTEDETIGWIYQYFTPKELRDQARKESAAPRNSYELAFRNQFFTPRYVVRFLGDNTLGRIWYEMMQGRTRLVDKCEYMVRRPNEVWLKEGEQPPIQEPATKNQELSQEELLRQPVHIPFRAKKDPRDIKLLDPAEGSGHFLLYGFDLMEVIYLEAWEDPDLGKRLKADFQSLEAYKRQIPELILRHNLHGIDIDLRAVQIAALALWLRAQRAWQEMGISADQRLRITKSNLVCAEPMPGEADLLEEFVATLQPKVLGQLVRVVFDKMKLAGEAGSLLKIEEELRDAIAAAKKQWQSGPPTEQMELFGDVSKPKQEEMAFDISGVTDEQFWNEAEVRVLDALSSYATKATLDARIKRRLFAEDAARGFAFVDICRQKFDVVQMNPPFGDASLPSKAYLDETYGDTKGDVYKAFVECFQTRLVPSGLLGIISSRTGFFLTHSEDWRTRVVLRLYRPLVLADLGMGVLDAMVEVAAYVLRSLSVDESRNLTLSLAADITKVELDRQGRFSLPKWQAVRNGLKRYQAISELEQLQAAGFIQRCLGDSVRYTPMRREDKADAKFSDLNHPPLVCVRLLSEKDKEKALAETLNARSTHNMFVCDPHEFRKVPSSPFAYWVGSRVRSLFTTLAPTESAGRRVTLGLSTKYDFRFVRVWWEVDSKSIGRDRKWANYANGGSYSPYFSNYPAVVLAENNFAELRIYLADKFPYLKGNLGWILHDENDYRSPAISWPLRTHAFSPAILPTNCFFSARTYAAIIRSDEIAAYLGLFASHAVDFLLKISLGRAGHPEFVTSVVRALPLPQNVEQQTRLANVAISAWRVKRSLAEVEATSHPFCVPALLAVSGDTLVSRAASWAAKVHANFELVAAMQAEINDMSFQLYGLDNSDRIALTSTQSAESTSHLAEEDGDEEEERSTSDEVAILVSDFLSYAIGAVCGRWDLRLATGNREPPPLPEPFDPLPICAAGMLQNSAGLPAEETDVTHDYPITIDWDGLLVDDPDHDDDLVRRVREVLAVIWKDSAEAIEQEVCEILGVKELRDYFRKPGNGGFWMDHVKRYSKSRRKAPIYWLLQSAGKNYALWIYYHRLDKDLLFKALVKYVEPKLKLERDRVEQYRNELLAAGSSGRSAKALERRLADQEDLLSDLQDFHDKLRRAADLRLEPDLNDGVVLNIASLWELVPWKEAKSYWDELMAGEYEWSSIGKQLRAKGIVK